MTVTRDIIYNMTSLAMLILGILCTLYGVSYDVIIMEIIGTITVVSAMCRTYQPPKEKCVGEPEPSEETTVPCPIKGAKE